MKSLLVYFLYYYIDFSVLSTLSWITGHAFQGTCSAPRFILYCCTGSNLRRLVLHLHENTFIISRFFQYYLRFHLQSALQLLSFLAVCAACLKFRWSWKEIQLNSIHVHVSGEMISHCDSTAVSLEMVSIRSDLPHTRILINNISGVWK